MYRVGEKDLITSNLSGFAIKSREIRWSLSVQNWTTNKIPDSPNNSDVKF